MSEGNEDLEVADEPADTKPSQPEKGGLDPTTRLAFLKEEYLLLQRFYEDYDARALTVKGWSASIAIVALGAGFHSSKYLWLFASAASLILWAVEAFWKSFQYLYSPRIVALEQAFRLGTSTRMAPFQIYSSWFKAARDGGFKFFTNARLLIVAIPHGATCIAGLALFILETFGFMSIARSR